VQVIKLVIVFSVVFLAGVFVGVFLNLPTLYREIDGVQYVKDMEGEWHSMSEKTFTIVRMEEGLND